MHLDDFSAIGLFTQCSVLTDSMEKKKKCLFICNSIRARVAKQESTLHCSTDRFFLCAASRLFYWFGFKSLSGPLVIFWEEMSYQNVNCQLQQVHVCIAGKWAMAKTRYCNSRVRQRTTQDKLVMILGLKKDSYREETSNTPQHDYQHTLVP